MAALHTVEQDHRLVLEKMQAMKETMSCLEDAEGAGCERAIQRLRELHQYFTREFASHLEEEETTLFPLLERQPGGDQLVARLRDDHADIRRRCEELGNCLQVSAELEDGGPPMVLRDLFAYACELWAVLDNHAHAETRAVHEAIARSFVGELAGMPR
jgi:iron-sulfur cluster repair protein YtfE (RIC family)